MRKVILRTALITLAAIIAVVFVAGVSMYAFAPAAASDFFSDLNWKGTALKLSERAYKKDGSDENLKRAFRYAVIKGKDGKIIQYGKEINKRADAGTYECSDNEYFYVGGCVSCAILRTDNIDSAITYALGHSKCYGGGEDNPNPMEVLILYGDGNGNTKLLEAIQERLEEFKDSMKDIWDIEGECKEDYDRVTDDLNNLDKLLKKLKK